MKILRLWRRLWRIERMEDAGVRLDDVVAPLLVAGGDEETHVAAEWSNLIHSYYFDFLMFQVLPNFLFSSSKCKKVGYKTIILFLAITRRAVFSH
jgi:hypothetical protein